LGNANNDTVYVNDTIRIGATDSGDASLFFGEGSVAGSDYGARWYWDSGYTFTWYTRNAGTDTALFDYVTNDLNYINWRRHFHMQNKEINYNSQIHFNAGTRFVGSNTNYLIFRSDATNAGGIIVQDGSVTTKGYTGYWDSAGGGILNNTGNWAVRYNFGNANSGGTLYGAWVVNGNISASNLSGTNTGDQTVGNGTITIAAGTGVGVGTTNTFTTNQSGATTVTISNSGVTSNVAGTGISVSGATGAVTITNSSPNATHTGDVTGATALTIANDAVTTVKILNANVTNAKLANSSLTIGSTAISLGATATTIAGLTSVTSTTFVGALTGNATTATALTSMNISQFTNNSGYLTSAVTSLAGTTNRITVSGATGAVTLNLPQDIHTGASPSFSGLTVTGITMTNLTGAYQNTTVYDSPRTQSATPSRGIRAPASSIQFTDSYAIAPFYTYRSTGDWPVPYGIGWGTGGESSGIFQRYASNGSSFGDMIFYTGNDGSGAFSFRRHTWEGTTYFAAGSGELNTELFRIDWAGKATATSFALPGGFTITDPGSGYAAFSNWVLLGTTGFYSSTNSAHLLPNPGTYGSWKITGTRGGWYGIEFDSGVSLMVNSTEVGFHRNGIGWQMRWSVGTGYIHKGSNGGGTEATILDSSNYTSYTPGLGTNNTLTGINVINNTSNTLINNLSGNLGLTMFQATAGTDAYMTFHIGGDYAAYLGLGGAENDLVYGGWSAGNNRHRILHSGNAAYAWNMNQYVRTTDSPTFNTVTANITGNAYNNLSNDYKDIYVYGDVNTYYVVLIQGEYLYSFGRYSVTRGYNWTGPDTWNIATHKGGLTLDWEWSGDTAWGGNDKAIRIIEFNETYSTMVAGLGYPVTGGVIIWLRGGGVNGAQYRIRTPNGSNSVVTVYDGLSIANHVASTTFTAGDSTVFSTRANTNNVSAEILARYPVRATGGLFDGNNAVLHAGNYNSYSPTLTGTGASGTWGISVTGNAVTAGGLAVHGGRNNEANKIVRTDSNGYIQAGWINTTSGDMPDTESINKIYCSSDDYVRYKGVADFKQQIGLTYKNSTPRSTSTTDTNYWTGMMGWGTTDFNTMITWGCGFIDSWASPGNSPGAGYTHFVGVQALHYTNGDTDGTDNYGYQLVAGSGVNSPLFLRVNWGSAGSWKTMLDSLNFNSYSPSLTGNGASGNWAINVTGNAATATILQTARNINGTSFNGSAAITTATWGTARTLTIGSTGKSVDGSAAIAWSLAEIGAAATNQTMFIGTTSVAINRASSAITLTGVSIDGNAATATTATNVTIANGSVTLAKIENITAYTILGNSNASAAATPAALSVATVATMLSGQTMNINGSSTSCSGTATNATTAGGLAVHTGTNDEANKIVRTQGNGYIMAGWINTISGDNGTTAIDRVYASSDGYIRYYTPANFRTVLDVPTRAGSGASGNWAINITGNATTATSATSATTATNVAASGITGQTGMWTSAVRPGPYRLYRNDDNSAYNVQLTWQAHRTNYWSLRGYLNDTFHAECFVVYSGYADTAGALTTTSNYQVANLGINVAASNKLHINGDNANPAIRVDNGAVVLAASVASNGRGFYGWLPISIGGTTKWIQLYNT